MKDPRQSLKPHLLKLQKEGREAAAKPFTPESLRDALIDGAKKGEKVVRIAPSPLVDVTKTEAVAAGLAYLAALPLSYHWSMVMSLMGEEYGVLEVRIE